MIESIESLVEPFQEAICQTKDYKQRAFLMASLEVLKEQALRIEQLQAELDGRMWSPKEW